MGLTSSNCIGSISGSGAGGGVISAGLGATYTHEDCLKIEAAKILLSIRDERGRALEIEDAKKILYSIDYLHAAVSDPGYSAEVADGGDLVQVQVSDLNKNRPYWCSRVTQGSSHSDRVKCGLALAD